MFHTLLWPHTVAAGEIIWEGKSQLGMSFKVRSDFTPKLTGFCLDYEGVPYGDWLFKTQFLTQD